MNRQESASHQFVNIKDPLHIIIIIVFCSESSLAHHARYKMTLELQNKVCTNYSRQTYSANDDDDDDQ